MDSILDHSGKIAIGLLIGSILFSSNFLMFLAVIAAVAWIITS